MPKCRSIRPLKSFQNFAPKLAPEQIQEQGKRILALKQGFFILIFLVRKSAWEGTSGPQYQSIPKENKFLTGQEISHGAGCHDIVSYVTNFVLCGNKILQASMSSVVSQSLL